MSRLYKPQGLRCGIPALILCLLVPSSASSAQPAPAKADFPADGTIEVPAFRLPPSIFASPEARRITAADDVFKEVRRCASARLGGANAPPDDDLEAKLRWERVFGPCVDELYFEPLARKQEKAFPVTIKAGSVDSVSRDTALSTVIHTHAELTKAGVPAELAVWDGLGHAFFYDPDIPESREVYAVVVSFFDRFLGKSAAP